MDARIAASTAAKASRSDNTTRNVVHADRTFTKFLRQAQTSSSRCSTLLHSLFDDEAAQKAQATSSTHALFRYMLENNRDGDLVKILQEYALKRAETIKYKSLLTEMRSLKTHVVDAFNASSSSKNECNANDDKGQQLIVARIGDIFSHEHLKNTRNYINRQQVRGFTSVLEANGEDVDDNDDDEDGSSAPPLPPNNDPGKNYCAAFTFKQTVQLGERMFATAQIFFLALTNLLRVLGCRPSSLHTMKFVKTLESSFDLHENHLWRVRTEYSKNKNIPQSFAVAMDMYNPILCPLLSTAIALTQVKPSLVIDKEADTLFGILYASTREHARANGSKTLPSDRTLREQFKATIVGGAISDSPTDYLGLYSYRKFVVTHLVNAFHCNELHRAGWIEFQRQATAQATGSTTAASWVSSVDVSSHYIGLESAGDERMALILSGRHPDTPYKNAMLQWLVRNCPAEVVDGIAADVFPGNVRGCFLGCSAGSELPRALVYALLIGKAKLCVKLREAFGQRCGIFDRACFESPVVEALLRHLRGIPLYPFAEPNTTYLSYLQQGRMSHFEVNDATGALECVEFVKKPVRVVCEAFDLKSTTKSTTKSKKETVDEDENENELVAQVIDLALDSDSDAEVHAEHAAAVRENDEDEDDDTEAAVAADDKENLADATADIEATFTTRLGYDRATTTVTLSESTDTFMADLLQALQRHYNTRGRLADLLRTIFKQWTRPLSATDSFPALELWPEPAMHALKRASLASKNKVASRLHYAYISRRDVVKLCVKHFVTIDKAIAAFEAAKLKTLKEVKQFCKAYGETGQRTR